MHFQGIDHHSLLQHSTFLGTCRWVIRGNQTHVGVSINGGTPFTMVVYIGKSYSNDLELMILRKHQHFRNTWNGRFPTSREPISLSLSDSIRSICLKSIFLAMAILYKYGQTPSLISSSICFHLCSNPAECISRQNAILCSSVLYIQCICSYLPYSEILVNNSK
jgi:hypothetical protein